MKIVPQNYLPLRRGPNHFSEVEWLKSLNLIFMDRERNKNRKKVGRKPKADKAKYKYAFRLTEVENAKFLALFDQSGLPNKAAFAKKSILENEIKVVYYDMGIMNFYTRLTNFYSLFRAVGTNYNQVVKILYRHFPEKKAAAYLYPLEKQTAELAKLFRLITVKIQVLEGKHVAEGVISVEKNNKGV